MKQTILLTSIQATAILATIGTLVALPFALVLNGLLDVLVAAAIALIIGAAGILGWTKWHSNLRLQKMPLGERQDWYFVIGFFVTIIVAGTSLLALATYGAQTVSTTQCITPRVNITSPNCEATITTSKAPSVEYSSLYWSYGAIGAIVVVLGAVGLPSFLILAGIFYLKSTAKRRRHK